VVTENTWAVSTQLCGFRQRAGRRDARKECVDMSCLKTAGTTGPVTVLLGWMASLPKPLPLLPTRHKG